jgi:putative aldouronate transport system permease protein
MLKTKAIKTKSLVKRGADDVFIDVFCYGGLAVIALIMLYPFLNLISVAFSTYVEFLKNPMMIIPRDITFDAFRYVTASATLWRSYAITIFITAMGTFLSLVVTITMAYPLSKSFLKGNRIIFGLLIFSMMFGGGLIPSFLLIKGLGMYDTIWALIIPGLLNSYNVILTVNFFRSMPESLEDAAHIDGAGDFYTLTRIILPLSGPIISTIGLFVGVQYWNSFFDAIVYLADRSKWPLQLFLREILLAANNKALLAGGNLAELQDVVPPVSIRYATVIVVMLPIMCIYPFLQKFFSKGVMLGAVKG